MVKDSSDKNIYGRTLLSKERLYEILFSFVERVIPDFPEYMRNYGIKGENQITASLEDYLSDCVIDKGLPFKFQNQYPYRNSTRSSDMGIKIRRFSNGRNRTDQNPFCVIEAKRFESSKHSNEYILGERGGLERFKRNLHATNLSYSIMVGYVQKHNALFWLEKVNDKIQDLSRTNKDTSISWSTKDKLIQVRNELFYFKARSTNTRKGLKELTLFHFWIILS
jgi:hypothetical protein